MFNREKAIKALSRQDGTWVSYRDRQVTKWDSVHPYECESWEGDNYEYFETESLAEALDFLGGAV